MAPTPRAVPSKEGAVTPPPSAKPSSHGCSAPHLTAHPVLIPMWPVGSDARSQILPTTPKPPPPLLGHTITQVTNYRLSPEKLNKIPPKRPREGETGYLSRSSCPQSSRLPGPCLQSVCSSQQGQILSLKVRAVLAWQADLSQRGPGLPRAQPWTQLCSSSVCSSCIKAAGGSAELSLVLRLLPGSLPQQGNALPSPSPAPCG